MCYIGANNDVRQCVFTPTMPLVPIDIQFSFSKAKHIEKNGIIIIHTHTHTNYTLIPKIASESNHSECYT